MDKSPIQILLIEDNPGDARLIGRMLAEQTVLPCELAWEETLAGGIARLNGGHADLVLLDLGLPGSTGIETVQRLLAGVAARPTLVVLSGLNDDEVGMQAVQAGAQDYLVKGLVDSAQLVRAIRYAIERSQAKEALRRAHDELECRVAARTAELANTVDALHEEIGEREQAEALLRKREQEFRTLAENLPDMVIRYDRQCRRFYANPAFYSETAMAAGPGAQWQGEPPGAQYLPILHQVMRDGGATEVVLESAAAHGRPVHHAFHVVAEYNPDGEVVGVLAIGRNITGLKETERRLQESQQQLRQLAARADAVREEERKFLTREIHDEMGQYLSALRLGLSVLSLQFGAGNPALEDKTARLIAVVDSTIRVVRNVVAALRPAALDLGIASALEWLADEFTERSAVECSVSIEGGNAGLDDRRATEVFRIVQESLTNISRHAHATEVSIALRQDGSHYCLDVRDNGQGFDPAARKRKSFGLVGMRERAINLGGSAEITSAPGQGTLVSVRFPINSEWVEP